jgi:hypothetical protein
MSSPGPSIAKTIGSEAYGRRMLSNSPVTCKTTRVASAPSATSAVSSGSKVNLLLPVPVKVLPAAADRNLEALSHAGAR